MLVSGVRSRRPMTLAGDVTVIDIADPQAVPLTVNLLDPGPGRHVQAHFRPAGRACSRPRSAWRARSPRRCGPGCGGRTRTAAGICAPAGTRVPALGGSPAVPSFRQVRMATVAAADELGYEPGMRAAVHGFVAARLGALWAGPAGRFLEGGHPADLGRLLRGDRARDRQCGGRRGGGLVPGPRAAAQAGRVAASLSRTVWLILVAPPAGRTALGASPRGRAWFSAGCERTCGEPGRRRHRGDFDILKKKYGGGTSVAGGQTGRVPPNFLLRCCPAAGRWRAAACAGGAPATATNCTPAGVLAGAPRPGLAPALGADAGAGLPDRPAGAPGACPRCARAGRR